MIRIFTLFFFSLLLTGCQLDEGDNELTELTELNGIWKSNEPNIQEEYLQFGNGEINVLYIVESLNCSRIIRTYEIATLEPDMFIYESGDKINSFEDIYSRYSDDFPGECESHSTKEVTVKIGFSQLPEALEDYHLDNETSVNMGVKIAFDTDNSGTISMGDVILTLATPVVGGQISPTWQALPTDVFLVNFANSDGYSYGAVTEASASIQANQISLIANASDFIGIGDINNSTQIDVSSYYNIKSYTQSDRYPNTIDVVGQFMFSEAVETGFLVDTMDDVIVTNSDPDAQPINNPPIFDILSIEVEVTE